MIKTLQPAIILSFFLLSGVCHAGGSTTVAVTATVLSKSNCKFNTGSAAIAFGNLNPANPVDTTKSSTLTFRCAGSSPDASFSVTQDFGWYNTGPNGNRMRHTTVTTEFLPYTVSLTPSSGTVPKNTVQTLTISGTVKGSDFENAYAGNYSDTVTITISP